MAILQDGRVAKVEMGIASRHRSHIAMSTVFVVGREIHVGFPAWSINSSTSTVPESGSTRTYRATPCS